MEKFINIIKDSKTRIITALVMIVALSLIVVIDSNFLTWAILGIVYLFSFHEACKLFKIENMQIYSIAILIWIVCFFYPQGIIFILICMMILTAIMLQQGDFKFNLLLPFLYPTMPMVIFLTQYQYFGMFFVVWLILIIASCDAGAYFIGKAVGKTKFSSISPNKTKEGVYGGLLISIIVGTSFGMSNLSFITSLIVSFGVSVAGIYGDLFESFLKRRVNVKDSGNLFPGHGGMLDRVDSYLFGTIAMLALLESLIS